MGASEGHDLLIVFDGEPPEKAPDLVGSRNADDAIVDLSAGLDRPWWLVSSDRGLRARLVDLFTVTAYQHQLSS